MQTSLQNASIIASKIQRHSDGTPVEHVSSTTRGADRRSFDDAQLPLPCPRKLVLVRIPYPAPNTISVLSALKADIETKTMDGKMTHHMISSMYCCCTCMTSSNDGLSHCTTCIGCPTARARKLSGFEAESR